MLTGESWGGRAMIALGVGGDCGRRFRPQIEDSVRLCRKLGPGMPGICYYAVGRLEKGAPYEGSFQEFLDQLTFKYFIMPVLMVREGGIWLSDYSPGKAKPVMLQVRVHNIGGVPARNVGVEIHVRHIASNDRKRIASVVVPAIGNGMVDLEEDTVISDDHKVIDGTKHPISRYVKRTRVLLNRALVDAVWTPDRAGYHRIEVELAPSDGYTIIEGLAEKTIPVGK